MGQQRQGIQLCHESLNSTKVTGARKENVQHPALVDSQKILFSHLHVKLGLMKNFVKALNKTKAGFQYLYEKISRLSEAKIKERVFVGPQTRELLRDDNFHHLLHGKENKA